MIEAASLQTLILTRSEVATLLDLDACIASVEQAFASHGNAAGPPPGIIGVHVANGGFHIKAGALELSRSYFAAKSNANFMNNRLDYGLPTIQGVVVLHDAEHGFPLAVMDSIEISIRRTGAATAVAAKYLADPNSRVAAIAGCGAQGRVQLQAVARVMSLEHAYVWDIDQGRAQQLATELSEELMFSVISTRDFRAAAVEADICITCTPSQEYLLGSADVKPGAFVAGVGVDNPHKRELDPLLLRRSKVVVDVLKQCETIGDWHHALEAGVVTRDDVYAELGAVVAGTIPGRTADNELFVFDSTGMALQDVAAAAVVYERASRTGVGQLVDFRS